MTVISIPANSVFTMHNSSKASLIKYDQINVLYEWNSDFAGHMSFEGKIYIYSLLLLPFVFYFHCYDQCLRFLQIKQNGSKHRGALLPRTCLSVILDFQYLMV